MGSIPSRGIPKILKMVPVATLLGAQHYKASTGLSSPKTKYSITNIACLILKCPNNKKRSENNQCLYSLEDRMEDWPLC